MPPQADVPFGLGFIAVFFFLGRCLLPEIFYLLTNVNGLGLPLAAHPGQAVE